MTQFNYDYIIDKFATDVANDEYNNFTKDEAEEVLQIEVANCEELPKYILEGDIVAFRCTYNKYSTFEELLEEYSSYAEDDIKDLLEEYEEVFLEELEDYQVNSIRELIDNLGVVKVYKEMIKDTHLDNEIKEIVLDRLAEETQIYLLNSGVYALLAF